jgi:HSP20 family protein
MAIIRWRPFAVGQFLTEDFPTIRLPKIGGDLAVDVYEKDKNIIAEMDLPGINPESLDITVEENYIRISGSREEKKEKEDKNYYHKEIQRGSFERTVRLPSNVKKEKAEAVFEDGTLRITIPKLEEKSRRN